MPVNCQSYIKQFEAIEDAYPNFRLTDKGQKEAFLRNGEKIFERWRNTFYTEKFAAEDRRMRGEPEALPVFIGNQEKALRMGWELLAKMRDVREELKLVMSTSPEPIHPEIPHQNGDSYTALSPSSSSILSN